MSPVKTSFLSDILRGAMLSAVCANAFVHEFCFFFTLRTLATFAAPRFIPVGTLSGVNVALLIAIKQLIPDHEIGIARVTVKTTFLPLAYLASVGVLTLCRIMSLGAFLYAALCFQIAWVYLRFYRRAETERGDASDGFAYATLFPSPVRPVVEVISNTAFAVFKPVLLASQTATSQKPELMQSVTGDRGTSVEAERRRQRALKALDERLNSANGDSESAV